MEKPTASTSSTNQFGNGSPGALLENVIEYYVLNSNNAKVSDIITNTEGRHERFNEDVGKAVLILMTTIRSEPVYGKITETVNNCQRQIFLNDEQSTLDSEMKRHFEKFLAKVNDFDYLKYFAIVCELIARLSTSTVDYLVTRAINNAKQSMKDHAPTNNYYMGADEYAKRFLMNVRYVQESG